MFYIVVELKPPHLVNTNRNLRGLGLGGGGGGGGVKMRRNTHQKQEEIVAQKNSFFTVPERHPTPSLE